MDPPEVYQGVPEYTSVLIELRHSDNFLLGRRTRREINSFER